ATPADEVPGAEAFLMSYRGGTGKKLPIGGAVQTLKKEEWIGKAFPEFKVKDIEGQEWSKADVTGRPMVLNFWYTGCGPCIREMPELNKWIEVYPDVTYLATTFDSAAQIKKIVESRPFLFTQIADDLFFFETFHVSGMPVTILVDKKGIIRHIEQGTGTAKLRYMQDKLQKLVSE
ncbi:TlpA family protein disulfide reductase, partial [Bacteroides uniformis]